MMKVTYRKKALLLGLVLLLYALLCPAFLTDRTLGIYRTFRHALNDDQVNRTTKAAAFGLTEVRFASKFPSVVVMGVR